MPNELSNSKTQRKRRAWPEKRRKKQAQLCRKTKPWKKATGPRSEEGKAAASQNAYKHGFRSADYCELRRLLCLQGRYLAAINARHDIKNMLEP